RVGGARVSAGEAPEDAIERLARIPHAGEHGVRFARDRAGIRLELVGPTGDLELERGELRDDARVLELLGDELIDRGTAGAILDGGVRGRERVLRALVVRVAARAAVDLLGDHAEAVEHDEIALVR